MAKYGYTHSTVFVRHVPEEGWSAKLYRRKYYRDDIKLPKKQYFETLQNLYDEVSELNPVDDYTKEQREQLQDTFDHAGRPADEVILNVYYKYKHRNIIIRNGHSKHRFVASAETQNGTRPPINEEVGFYNLDDAMNACIRWVDQDVAQSTSWVVYKIGVVLQVCLQVCWRTFICFPLISAIVVLFCTSKPSPEKVLWAQEHPNWKTAIGISAFISSMIFLYIGIEKSLFFIPEDWGMLDEDGEWDSLRGLVAFILSLLGSIAIGQLVLNLYKAESNKLTQNNKS